MLTTRQNRRYFIKIEVKDNNVEQAIRVLKRKLQKEGFFQGNENEKHLRKTIREKKENKN